MIKKSASTKKQATQQTQCATGYRSHQPTAFQCFCYSHQHAVHSPEHMSANGQQAFNSQRALFTASRLLPIANRLAEAANRLQTKSQQASNKPIQRQNHHTNTFFHQLHGAGHTCIQNNISFTHSASTVKFGLQTGGCLANVFP